MNSLDQLARRAGIEERFRDAKGEVRETSPATKIALLAAMGLKAENEAAAAKTLREMESSEWGRALPQVRVAVASDVPVMVDAIVCAGTERLLWRLTLEDGGERSGTAQLGAPTLVAKHQLDNRGLERHRLPLELGIPIGYHHLQLEGEQAECSLIVSPGRCWLPAAAEQSERLWGVAAQLYLLRSAKNWGIGDFSDLRTLVQLVDERGGDLVGLNPLHSMFLDKPEHASPYSPQDRLLLNVLNVDVEAVAELAHSPETQRLIASEHFQNRLRECRSAPLVDYAGVTALKMQVLKLLYERCRTAPDSSRWKQFELFRRERGRSFEQSCLFEALRQHFANIHGAPADWHSWAAEYRDPSSPAVARFAEEHADAITLYAWMQWLADEQLGAAAAAARKMRVGLYRDLAVGADANGAATWRNQDAVVSDAHAGAPPDVFNPAGQDWGLPPFQPRALFESGYRHFIDLLRANMRHAGGLRIDHIMVFQHLYWVPNGRSPGEGAYVLYPLDDLVGILALESYRQRCLVVGEDLGTVPDGFRERMAEANILSYRVLFFEQNVETGAFLPPQKYPRLALAVTGSHDLPTVKGWWRGNDIDLKEELNLFPTKDGASEARQRREQDRSELLKALREQRLLPSEETAGIEELILAVHAYLAKTEAFIAMVQLDDITAETDQVNVPATTNEHANWRRAVVRQPRKHG